MRERRARRNVYMSACVCAQGGATYVIVLTFSSVGMNNFFQHGGNAPIALFTCDKTFATETGEARPRRGAAWRRLGLTQRPGGEQMARLRAGLRTGHSL